MLVRECAARLIIMSIESDVAYWNLTISIIIIISDFGESKTPKGC